MGDQYSIVAFISISQKMQFLDSSDYIRALHASYLSKYNY